MMQGIGEIQPGCMTADRLLNGSPIFNPDVRLTQQVRKHPTDLGGCETVIAAQHPFKFQNHGLGNSQRSAGLDQFASNGTLALCQRISVIANVVTNQYIGVQTNRFVH